MTSLPDPLPSFADLWPARELGAWIVAIREGTTEQSIEAPFARALAHWLRARRDRGLLGRVGHAHGRLSWQIDAWNAFASGSDDVTARQMLVDLAHALVRGVVATEWALDDGIDPTRGAAVSAMHARIVDQIERGDTDAVTSPWNVVDRRTGSTISLVLRDWRPVVSPILWDEINETAVEAAPVRDEGMGLDIRSGLMTVLDPAKHPRLVEAIADDGEDADETPRMRRMALAARIAERNGIALVHADGPVDLLQSSDRIVATLVPKERRIDGFRRIGTIVPSAGVLVIGDAVAIAKANGHSETPAEIAESGLRIETTPGTWFLHGPDTGRVHDDLTTRLAADPEAAVLHRMDPDGPLRKAEGILSRLLRR